MFFQVPGEVPHIQPATVFEIAGWPITSSFLMINLVTVLIIVFVIWLNRELKVRPGKAQVIVELFYESVLRLIHQISGSKKVASKLFPLIASLFVFVGIGNLISLVPGLTSFTLDGHEILRSPTSDFNTTFALALAMMLMIQMRSIVDWGILGYIGKFLQFKGIYEGFKQGIGAGFVAIINFLIGLLDIVSEIAKVISLSVRLFGNIYAGEILMVIIMGGLAYGLPAVWLGMNIFVGVIQALVFGALVAAYYGAALKVDEAK